MMFANGLSARAAISSLDDKVHDVLVLGAGPAGISAGNRLKEKGLTNFLILEGRDRVGGRTLTDPIFGDRGAAWTHINDPRVLNNPEILQLALDSTINPAKILGFTLSYDTQNTHIYLDGERIERDRYLQRWDEIYSELQEILEREGRDMTIGEAMGYLHKCDSLDDAILRMECGGGTTGWDYKEVSTAAVIHHHSCASGVLYQEGLGNLIKAQAEPLKDYIHLNQRITSILHGEDGLWHIKVETPEGERTYHSKKVICTLPPPVLTCEEEGHRITHNLPQGKIKALKALPSGAMNKIMMKFPHGYLEQLGIPQNAHYEIIHHKLGNMFFIAQSGQDTLTGLVGGKQSIALENQPVETAVRYALDFLEQVPEFQSLRSHIIAADRTQWYSDIFARGSYSVPHPNMPRVRELAAKPYKGFHPAGEAYASDHHQNAGWETHVTGAMSSGKSAADHVMVELARTSSPAIAHP